MARSPKPLLAGVAFAATQVAFLPLANPVGAYSQTACGSGNLRWTYSGSQVPVRVGVSVPPSHSQETLYAIDSWQSYSGSPFTFTSDGARSLITAGSDGNSGFDGIAGWNCFSSGVYETGYAKYNTYYTNGYSDGQRQSVMAHEIGHTLGLSHAGGFANCADLPLMFYSTDIRYDTCNKKTPQQDDKNGISATY